MRADHQLSIMDKKEVCDFCRIVRKEARQTVIDARPVN